jgi:hypothetical protein
METLKNHKNALLKPRINPNPIVTKREDPSIPIGIRRDMILREFLSPKLDPIANEILKQLFQF